jgi:hypothetical protein
MTFLMHIFILIGVVFLTIQAILFFSGQLSYSDILGAVMSCSFLTFGWYFSKRIAMITSIDEKAITLIARKQSIHLQKNDIIAVRKMVRFTLLKRTWFIIHFFNEKGKKERWMFQEEPDIKLTENLEKMHIQLKNIP